MKYIDKIALNTSPYASSFPWWEEAYGMCIAIGGYSTAGTFNHIIYNKV